MDGNSPTPQPKIGAKGCLLGTFPTTFPQANILAWNDLKPKKNSPQIQNYLLISFTNKRSAKKAYWGANKGSPYLNPLTFKKNPIEVSCTSTESLMDEMQNLFNQSYSSQIPSLPSLIEGSSSSSGHRLSYCTTCTTTHLSGFICLPSTEANWVLETTFLSVLEKLPVPAAYTHLQPD